MGLGGLGIATVTAVTAFGVASWQANAAPSPGTPPGAAAEQPRVSDPRVAPEPATGTGSDPLTSAEVDRARKIAVIPLSGGKDAAGAAGPEYLSAELDAESGGRSAELYYYDYKTDKLVKQVVDLKTGKLAGSYSAAKMQPPASQHEVAAALDILLADPLAADLKDAYRAATARSSRASRAWCRTRTSIRRMRPTAAAQWQAPCPGWSCRPRTAYYRRQHQMVIDLSGRTVARLK
nr:hypothetical protein GCM10020092_090480 [Actinoplanes digitatis]